MNRILICDDEQDIVNALKIYLANPDYTFAEAHNGAEAVEAVAHGDFSLVLLDIMMPGMDGITAMAKIREFSNIPIILLTAKSEDADKILGLNVGADDYITKPFNPLEVAARVNSQLRRYIRLGAGAPSPETFVLGGVEVNDAEKSVTVDGEPVALTPKEYEILKLLIRTPGKVYSPREIYAAVWHERALPGCDNNVAVHIRHLREKIEINPNEPRYIKVVFGQGYLVPREARPNE